MAMQLRTCSLDLSHVVKGDVIDIKILMDDGREPLVKNLNVTLVVENKYLDERTITACRPINECFDQEFSIMHYYDVSKPDICSVKDLDVCPI